MIYKDEPMFPNNQRDRIPTGYLLSNEVLNTSIEFQTIELLVNRVPWKSTTQTFDKVIGCSPQIVSKVLLLKTTTTQLIEHGNVYLVAYIQTLPQCSSVYYMGRYSVGNQNRNINIRPTTEPLIYNLSCLQSILGQ